MDQKISLLDRIPCLQNGQLRVAHVIRNAHLRPLFLPNLKT